ncbi:MAG: alpha/beta hydrolase fold domain-containing protein, partial [Planctomycetota bacterium JB042]
MRPRLAPSVPLLPLVAFAAALSAPPASAQLFTKHSDLTFAVVPTEQGTESLELDLYVPNGVPAPLPLVVHVHGGGWKAGSKENPGGLFLLQSGFALASFEYRLSCQAKWPAQIHDVKGAVRWLRANAATYGLDPERFGVFGGSAGGHLAAFLGTSGGVGAVELGGEAFVLEGTTGGNLSFSSRVQAVGDFFGPTDFLWMDAFPS